MAREVTGVGPKPLFKSQLFSKSLEFVVKVHFRYD